MSTLRFFPFEFPRWNKSRAADAEGQARRLEQFELEILRAWADGTPALALADRVASFIAEALGDIGVGIYGSALRGHELIASAALSSEFREAADRPEALRWLSASAHRELESAPVHIHDAAAVADRRIRAEVVEETEVHSAWIARTPERLTFFALKQERGGFTAEQVALFEAVCKLLSRISLSPEGHARLQSLEGLSEEMVEATPAMLCVLDSEGLVLHSNRAFEQVFAWQADEADDQPLAERLVHARDRTRWNSWLSLVLRQESEVRHEARWRVREGADLIIEWLGTSIPGLDGPLLLATGRDVSSLRRAEQERDEMTDALRHAQKMEDIGTLTSGIAHDFNNHLTAIIGFTDLAAAAAEADSSIQSSLSEVMRAARLAAGVTRALLTFTRKTATNKEICDLGKIVQESMRLLARLLPSTIQIVSRLPEPGECMVWADATHVQQILMCLVINARDAMAEGGTLTLEVKEVVGRSARPSASILVQDTGHGMEPAVKARIFEPFFTTKQRGLGTGLGLSVMRSLVLEHGGRIEIESELGLGTRFEVIFPVQATIGDAEGPLRQASEKLVLVAEPDDFFRSILVSSLRQEGYQVFEARNATSCRAVCEAYCDVLDLVVLSQDMIPTDAERWTAELQRLQPALRLVMIEGAGGTGRNVVRDPRVLSLSKPFTVPELTESVADLLGTSTANQVSPR